EAAQPAKMAAMELMGEGDLAGASLKFTEVIQLAPTSLAYANRALCFAKLKKPNACIRDCNAALALNADSAKSLKTRGKAYRMLGEYELAHADLTSGQKIDFDEDTDIVQRLVAAKVKAL
ncbi:Hsc70-interacting protein, partial [Pavlovales sp. CCMP2436]